MSKIKKLSLEEAFKVDGLEHKKALLEKDKKLLDATRAKLETEIKSLSIMKENLDFRIKELAREGQELAEGIAKRLNIPVEKLVYDPKSLEIKD